MSGEGQMSRDQLLEVRARVENQLNILRTSGHSTPQLLALIAELRSILREVEAELAEEPADEPKAPRATDGVFTHPGSWWDWLGET